jgi:hypothetical protein
VTTAARETSLTSDEGPQLTSGYSFLVTGDMHLIELTGIRLRQSPKRPAAAADPRSGIARRRARVDVRRSHQSLWVTQEFLYPYPPAGSRGDGGAAAGGAVGHPPGRVPLSLGARAVWKRAGVLALILMAFDPNLLAHAGLATNDLP